MEDDDLAAQPPNGDSRIVAWLVADLGAAAQSLSTRSITVSDLVASFGHLALRAELEELDRYSRIICQGRELIFSFLKVTPAPGPASDPFDEH
jgi:hypothetical protein